MRPSPIHNTSKGPNNTQEGTKNLPGKDILYLRPQDATSTKKMQIISTVSSKFSMGRLET